MEKVEAFREDILWRSVLCRGQELTPSVQVSLSVPHRARSWTRWSPSNSADSRILRGRGTFLSFQEWLDQKELILNKSHEQVEILWVKIKDGSNKGHLVFVSQRAWSGAECWQSPFFQLQESWCSQAFNAVGGCHHLDSCWKAIQQTGGNSGDSWSASELLVQVLEKLSQIRGVSGCCVYQCEEAH